MLTFNARRSTSASLLKMQAALERHSAAADMQLAAFPPLFPSETDVQRLARLHGYQQCWHSLSSHVEVCLQTNSRQCTATNACAADTPAIHAPTEHPVAGLGASGKSFHG